MSVFVLDRRGKALMPCSEKRARKLLDSGRGSFNIQTSTGLIQGISHRYCHMIQRADGYGYFINQDSILKEENQSREKHDVLSLPALKGEVSRTTGWKKQKRLSSEFLEQQVKVHQNRLDEQDIKYAEIEKTTPG